MRERGLAPAVPARVDEHRFDVSRRRRRGLGNRAGQGENNRKRFLRERPRDRVRTEIVRDESLRTDHRHGVGRIDHDVVAKRQAVGREESREREIGRRGAGLGEDRIEHQEDAPSALGVLLQRPEFRRQKGRLRARHDDHARVGG